MNFAKLNSSSRMIIILILGLILLFRPESALSLLIRVSGICILFIGIIGIFSFFLNKEKNSTSISSLISSVLYFIISLIFLINPSFISSLFPIFMGVVIIFSGIQMLMKSVQIKKILVNDSPTSIVLSVITILLGIFISFHPTFINNVILQTIGLVLIFTAAVGLWISSRRY